MTQMAQMVRTRNQEPETKNQEPGQEYPQIKQITQIHGFLARPTVYGTRFTDKVA
jgi:hypothetical protein